MTQPKNLADLFPLSPMQHLMLLHALGSPSQAALLNQLCYEIRGPLDEDAFRRGWDALVARHPALRTCVLWEGLPEPLQAVRGRVSLPFRTLDLTDVSEDERRRRCESMRREDADASMPLGKAPLMRCSLARLPDDCHLFVWTIHHLVVDRWSHGVLFEDLRALYAAFLRGEDTRPSPVRGFREYIAWLALRDPAEAMRFWRDDLRGFTQPALLTGNGTKSAREARRTTRRMVSSEVSAALRTKAARWRVTSGAMILSAIGLAFARRFDRSDVLVGLTVSGRPPDLEGAESIVGSFVNNVPARLRIDGELPVAEWIRSVQREQARRQAFAHVSLRDIRECAEVPYPLPLFDTLVVLNLSEPSDGAWPDLEWRLVSSTLDAGYPVVLAIGMEESEFVLTLVHDAPFDGAAILAEIATAIDAIARGPVDATVGSLAPGLAGSAPAPPSERQGEIVVPPSPKESGAVAADSLLQLWRDVLGVDDVGLDDDFFGLGGSSLQALELFVRLERLLGRTVPLSTLFRAGSVRALLAELGRPVERSGPLVRIRSSGTRLPLVAVPGIGGSVVGLAGLARALGPSQPFFGLESPGLDGHEAPLTSIEAIAERYVEEVLHNVNRPFHLLGFCWGAAVAYEMARRFDVVGRAPVALAMIDPALLLRRETPSATGAEAAFVRRRLELYWDELRDADWRQRGEFVARKARRVASVIAGDGARAESRTEFHRFKVESANREAIARYFPQAYRGRATVFLSSGRDFDAGEDPRLEWLQLIHPPPEIAYVDGADSGDVISPAHVGAFAATLRDRLDAWAELAASR
jgi:thioesterase domain-containing protein/acyl carrier protein